LFKYHNGFQFTNLVSRLALYSGTFTTDGNNPACKRYTDNQHQYQVLNSELTCTVRIIVKFSKTHISIVNCALLTKIKTNEFKIFKSTMYNKTEICKVECSQTIVDYLSCDAI